MARGKCNVHINDLCGYTSPRIGVFYYTLMLAIFSFVVIWSVAIQQRYRLKALDIVGSTRLQLHSPAAPYALFPANTSYCIGGSPVPSMASPPLPCRFYDQYDAVDPGLEPAAMFVSTRITESNWSLPNGCQYQPDPTCQYVQQGTSAAYFIGNVEMFTLLIDHTFSSQSLSISKSAMSMPGKLVDQNGHAMDPCSAYAPFPAGCDSHVHIGKADGSSADIVPLATLLQAGGISSLDDLAGSLNESHRNAGTVLVISISYTNYYLDTGSFSEEYFQYTYSVASVNDAEFKYEEVIPNPGSGLSDRRILDRHGIRILIKQSGSVGQFDILTLIISLTSSLGLVALASTIVDVVATKCMPLRHIYDQYKKVDSIDFEALHLSAEELRLFAKEDLVNPKPRFIQQLHIQNVDEENSGSFASQAAALAQATPSTTQQYRAQMQPVYGLNTTTAPYSYAAPTLSNAYHATGEAALRTPLLDRRDSAASGPNSNDRRGSGISLKSQQSRPLPSGPPPPLVSRTSFSSPQKSPSGPHVVVTHAPVMPARPPFESIASGDGSASEDEVV